MMAWFFVTVISAVDHPGMDEKAMQELVDRTSRALVPVGVGLNLAWASLTMILFLAVRGRMECEAE
jgi:hypothetical protein